MLNGYGVTCRASGESRRRRIARIGVQVFRFLSVVLFAPCVASVPAVDAKQPPPPQYVITTLPPGTVGGEFSVTGTETTPFGQPFLVLTVFIEDLGTGKRIASFPGIVPAPNGSWTTPAFGLPNGKYQAFPTPSAPGCATWGATGAIFAVKN